MNSSYGKKAILAACSETKKNRKDRTISLPDDILIHILSLLPLKDAGRSSILSHRWRYLWTYLPSLDFDAPEMINYVYDCEFRAEAVELQTSKYVQWVNQVIRASRARSIDSFRVHFFLHSNLSGDMDSWVKFVVERGVQNLELQCLYDTIGHPQYAFPKMQPCFQTRIKLLKSLHLKEVGITSEQLECLLSECLLLEKIVISHSRCLIRLNIMVPAVQLKYLHIGVCSELTSVMISAPTPNLISFRLHGRISSFRIDYAPKLVDLYIGLTFFLSPVFHPLCGYFSQLHTLTIGVARLWDKEKVMLLCLGQLKRLTLCVTGCNFAGDQRLIFLSSLLASAPSVQYFTLQIESTSVGYGVFVPEDNAAFRLQDLQVVEFRGFVWQKAHIDIALYLVRVAGVSLEKLIIDPWEGSPIHLGNPTRRELLCLFERDEEKEQLVRKQAPTILGKELPPGVELVVI